MPPLVFIHIPKTAGTTLHKILSHQFKPSETAIHHDAGGIPSDELVARMSGSDPAVKLVMGHTSARFHDRVPDVRYITCLRDPVARLVSHYHHARLDPTHYLHEALVRGGWGPADYVASGLSGELSDGMTRMIAGMDDFHHGGVDEAVFQRAIRNLEERFEVVLLTETFDSGLLDAASRLGWKTPYYIPRKKGRYAGAPPLGEEERRTIEARNTHDRRLYEWVRANRTPATDGAAAARLEDFRKRNAVRGRAVFCWREVKRRMGMVP